MGELHSPSMEIWVALIIVVISALIVGKLAAVDCVCWNKQTWMKTPDDLLPKVMRKPSSFQDRNRPFSPTDRKKKKKNPTYACGTRTLYSHQPGLLSNPGPVVFPHRPSQVSRTTPVKYRPSDSSPMFSPRRADPQRGLQSPKKKRSPRRKKSYSSIESGVPKQTLPFPLVLERFS